MIRLMSDDPLDPSDESLKERVRRYLKEDFNHRDNIPFVFIEHYSGNFPDCPPKWVKNSTELKPLWDIAETLSEFYSYPLSVSFDRKTNILDHAEDYRTSEVKPDHKLFEVSRHTDFSYDDWCSAMERYLRERAVKSNS